MDAELFLKQYKQKHEKPDLKKDYLTPNEYAEKMKIHRLTVIRRIQKGEIEAHKEGRLWRIPI